MDIRVTLSMSTMLLVLLQVWYSKEFFFYNEEDEFLRQCRLGRKIKSAGKAIGCWGSGVKLSLTVMTCF
jgi:hypothetical protein